MSTYLIRSKRQGDFKKPNFQSENNYLARLTTMGYPQAVIDDIFLLKSTPPHVDNINRSLTPDLKRKIVHADNQW